MERHRFGHQRPVRRRRKWVLAGVVLVSLLLATFVSVSTFVVVRGAGNVSSGVGDAEGDVGLDETGGAPSSKGDGDVGGQARPDGSRDGDVTNGSTNEGQVDTLEERAEEALDAYQREADCALAYAGYLDLLGNVWSCVVVGHGWSEICLVTGGGENDEPDVRVVRIEGEGLEVTALHTL